MQKEPAVRMPPVFPLSATGKAEQLKSSDTQISAAGSRGSRELKYKVIHICYKAYT